MTSYKFLGTIIKNGGKKGQKYEKRANFKIVDEVLQDATVNRLAFPIECYYYYLN